MCVFEAHVDEMGFIVTTEGGTYCTVSKWTRGEIVRAFGVSPRFAAWRHVRHVELGVPLHELRSPPIAADWLTAYFAPIVSGDDVVVR